MTSPTCTDNLDNNSQPVLCADCSNEQPTVAKPRSLPVVQVVVSEAKTMPPNFNRRMSQPTKVSQRGVVDREKREAFHFFEYLIRTW